MGKENEGTTIPGELGNENDVIIEELIVAEEGEATGDEFVPTPTQEKAIARGWRPEEEWTGDPDAWVDARNYVQHGELMDEISSQKKANKRLTKTMDKFTKMQADVEKRAMISAKADLLADKEEALINQDMAAVVQIDEDIKANDKALVEAELNPKSSKQESAEAFDAYFEDTWKVQNDWYGKNDIMKMYADKIGVELYDGNPLLDAEEVFTKLDGIMKEKFPQEFENQQRQRPAAVGSGSVGGQGGGRSTVNKAVSNLNEHEIKVGNEYVKAGYFKDLAEYADELAKL